jgi:hypothetical protein
VSLLIGFPFVANIGKVNLAARKADFSWKDGTNKEKSVVLGQASSIIVALNLVRNKGLLRRPQDGF